MAGRSSVAAYERLRPHRLGPLRPSSAAGVFTVEALMQGADGREEHQPSAREDGFVQRSRDERGNGQSVKTKSLKSKNYEYTTPEIFHNRKGGNPYNS